MAEGFTPTPEDVQELRQRLGAREEKSATLNDQRNVVLETESPDDAAYDLKKSQELGIPREAIGGARDDYKAEDTLAKMQKLRTETPKTGAWLADPDNYAVARDEAEDLSFMERTVLTYLDLTQTGKVGEAVATIGPALETSFAGMTAAMLEAPGITPADQALMASTSSVRGVEEAKAQIGRAADAVKVPDVKVPAIRNPFAKAKVRVPEALDPARIRDRASRNALAAALAASQRLEDARPKGVTPESSAILSGVGSMAEMAPAMAAGILTRRPDVPMAIMGRQVYGQSYAKARAEGLDPGGAVLYGGAMSGVERVTERIGLEFLFGRTLAGETLGRRLFASMAAEQVQEQFATLGQDFVDWQVLNPEKTMAEFIEERGPAAYQTAIATFIASAPTNTAVLGTEAILKDMARKEAMSGMTPGETLISDVLDKATASKLGTRSPEKLADLLGRVTEGTTAETVVVDLDGVVDALNQKGVDPTETLAALGVSEDQLAQKWERFGEAEVALATVAASPIMRQHRDAIQPHLRTSNEEYTPAGKERARTELETDIQSAADTIREAMAAGRELEAQTEAVADRVRQRIRGAGILAERAQEDASVAIQTAMVTTMARRLKIDPVEYYDQHYPRIQGSFDGMVAEEGALEQRFENILTYLEPQERGNEAFSDERLTPSQNKAVEMRRNGYTNKEVADEMDIDEANVRVLLSKAKARAGGDATLFPEVRQPPERAVEVLRLMRDGLEIAQIGERLGVSDATVTSTAAMARKAIRAGGQAVPDWLEKRSGAREDALSMEEEDALAQLIGPKATSANKAILDAAKKMAKEKVKAGKGLLSGTKPKYTRQQIWDKTAEMGQPWYQDDNGDWISEIEDGVIVVKDRKGKLEEVVQFPSIYAEYPELRRIKADARSRATVRADEGRMEPNDIGGWYDPGAIFGVKMRIVSTGDRGRYTATHEIQHAVDDIEKRTMGGKKDVYAKKPTERRAFNTMYRRLWTMEERIATPPWKTEQEAIDWWIGGRMMDAPAARFTKEGTFDPQPGPERPAPPQMPERGQNAEFSPETTGFVQGEVDVTQEFDERRQRTVTRIIPIEKSGDFEKLLGRTFLSVKSIATAMANNPRLRTVVLDEKPEPLSEAESAEFNKAVSAEISELTKLAKRLREQIEDEVSWKAMFGVYGSVDEGQIYTLLASIETPIVTQSVSREGLARIIRRHVQTRLPEWMGKEATKTEDVPQAVSADIRKAVRIPIAMESAAQAFRARGAQPDKASKRPPKISPSEVKKVEAALATKLIDLDAPMKDQAPEHYQAIRGFWDAETARTGMYEEENGEMVPDYVDFWESDYWLADWNGARPLDDRSAQEVLELLARRSNDESGGKWMEGLIASMRQAGIIGGRYVPGGVRPPDQEGPPQTQSIVIFDERAPVLLTDPSGNLMQQRRGQFSPSRNIITMFEAADVTTLMHEGAHWYLAEIERMAASPEAHPFVTEQWEAVKAWGKVGPDFRMYDDLGRVTDEGRELQEAFAETFEVYLQTGKAPVPSLREAFRAFKAWITALWRDIRTGKIRLPERANLSPDIVRVMDRMLAVDEEIESQTAEVVTKAEAMANDLYGRGIITKRQRDAAIMNLDEAREAAKEDLMAQIMQAELRVREAQLSAEQRRIKGDVTREYDRSAVGRAVSWLGYGQWKGDVPAGETVGEEEFYQGIDRGEAIEWREAVRKGLDMSTPARMQRAKEMGFDTAEVFYHGTGDLTNFSVGFDPNMTGLGNDQLGSGFYFTNQAATASGYTTRRLPTGESKLGGEDAPGVLPVVLNIQNPIVLEGREILSEKIDVTARQAEEIIRKSPLINADVDENPLGNWHDIWSEGVQDWMIGDVAASYEGNILAIENDFFRGNSEAFRRAVRDVLGYDGVIQKFDSGEVHKVAWFPEQVRSVHAAFDPANEGSADLLAQSIRTAATMRPEAINEWVVANVSASIQTMRNGEELTTLAWNLTEEEGSPEVSMTLRLRDNGQADTFLFLNNGIADALRSVTDVRKRTRMGMDMFSQALMVMRQYASETPDLKAFNFVAAESKAKGTNPKSREKLYRSMLSKLRVDGYIAYEVQKQTSTVMDEGGEKAASPFLPPAEDGPMVGFVLVREGVDPNEFAGERVLRGRPEKSGEVVSAITSKRLTPADTAPDGGADGGSRDGAGRDAAAGAVDDTLGQSLPGFYSALGRFIASSNTARAPAAQWKGMIQNAPGVKAEEVEWTGVLDWLDAAEGSVTREALAAFVEANGVTVEEVRKGGGSPAFQIEGEFNVPAVRDAIGRALRDGATDNGDLQMILENDGDFYRYMERSYPEYFEEDDADAGRLAERVLEGAEVDFGSQTKFETYVLPGGTGYTELLLTIPKMRGPETHWDEDSVVAHTRFKERTGPNGERVLALEEIQSDWHQKAREEGYEQPVDPEKADAAKVSLAQARDARDQAEAAVMNFIGEMEKPDLQTFFESLYRSSDRDDAFFDDLVESVYATADFRNLTEQQQQLIRRRGLQEMRMNYTGFSKEARAQIAELGANLDAAQLRFTEADQAYMNAAYPDGVPNAPFKNNAWANLVLKRMIRYAAENGFDAVAWIPGNVQNGQIVEDTGDNRGDFYDKIVPNLASKLGKKYGAKVTKTPMDMPAQARGTGWEDTGQPRAQIDAGAMSWWTLPLTPELAAAAMTEGFPLFQRGDPKGWGETAPPPDLPPMRLDLEAVRELYGEDAVRRLPRAIRDRSRDKTSIDGMLDIIRASAKTLKRKPQPTLFQFIRSRKARTVAGQTVPIKKWGIKGAADELKAMNREDLINEENGIHIDYMRETAAEAGYLAEDATVNDFLNAIDREARGEPVYSRYDQKEVEDQRFAQEWADWLDSQGVDIFETDMKKLKAQVAKVVTSTAADAVTPDQAAEMLGFPTGEDLLNVLSLMGNRDQWVKEETERRLRQEFGDPMADGTFAEEARVIAEAEVMSRAAEIEMEALARAVGEPAASKLAKEMAMDSLGLMTVKELEGWERFLNAERREMNNTLEAVKRGDMVQAFIHKRRQLVNMHLAKAAREKSIAIEKIRKDMLTYYSSKGRRDKIAPDYLEKIEALLEGYELRVSKQGPGEQRRRMSAKEYVDQMIADGREAEIAPEAMMLAELAGNKVWRGLTADEVDYLAGTVRNLAHLGRTKGRLMREQEKRRFDAVVAELVDTLMAAPTAKVRATSFTPTQFEKMKKGLREFDARLTRLEFQFEKLDGRTNGPLWNTLFRPFTEAADTETAMMRGAAAEMRRLYEMFSTSERNQLFHRRVATPELSVPGKDMTMMDIVVIGLNWGNAGNRKALLDGYGWDGAQVEAMLNRVLTDKHWDFIEGVWKLIGSYRADAFALEKAITGVEPKAVEGIEFTLANGRVIKGQYYPLQYDGAQARADSFMISRLDEKQALQDLGKTFSKPMTRTGHLKERVGSGGKPVKINIGVMHEHVQNVIHDIAYRRAVVDIYKIARDPRFADAYMSAAGLEQYQQLIPWIASIARERAGDPGGIVTKIMQQGRRNMSIVAMGFKFGTAIQQATGVLQGFTMIGPVYGAKGFVKALANGPGSFWSAWQKVAEKSEFMRDRPQGFDRDVRMVTNQLQERTPLGAMQRNAMMFTNLMDIVSSTAVWIGAYDKALDGRVEGIDRANEDDAIAYADSVVRQTQAAGKLQDLPQIMRGTEVEKLVTMMYSYFSGLYNLTRKQGTMARYGQMSRSAFVANMMILYVAVPLMASLLAGRLLGGEDDEDELLARAGKEIASNAVGTVPIFRDVASAAINPQFGYQMSPVGSGIERLTQAAARAAAGETLESEAAVKEAVNALGILFGLPSAQMIITGDYVYDLATGEEDPLEDPADAAREALLRNER